MVNLTTPDAPWVSKVAVEVEPAALKDPPWSGVWKTNLSSGKIQISELGKTIGLE